MTFVWSYISEITTTSPRGQWVNSMRPSDTYVYVPLNEASIGSRNGLSPDWHQAIDFYQNTTIFIQENAFEKLSAKWCPFCLRLNESTYHFLLSDGCGASIWHVTYSWLSSCLPSKFHLKVPGGRFHALCNTRKDSIAETSGFYIQPSF